MEVVLVDAASRRGAGPLAVEGDPDVIVRQVFAVVVHRLDQDAEVGVAGGSIK